MLFHRCLYHLIIDLVSEKDACFHLLSCFYFSLQNLGFDSAGTALILFLISFIGLFHIKNVICKKLNIKKDN